MPLASLMAAPWALLLSTPLAMPSSLPTIVMIVFAVLLFWLMMVRPMRKQQAKQAQLMSSLAEGTRVMLSSGIFGTLKHMGDKQAVIELAPGLEVTVVKQAISKVLSAADEEFEYTDDTADELGDAVTAASEQPVAELPATAAATSAPAVGEPGSVEPEDLAPGEQRERSGHQ